MVTFLIAAHYRPDRLGALLEAIGPENAIVHVDARTDIEPFLAVGRGAHFLSDRKTVTWGGYSQVAASLAMLEVALRSHRDSSHYVLLSGDSYPTQSLDSLRSYFTARSENQFLRTVAMPAPEAGKPIERISRYYFPFDRGTSWKTLPQRALNRISVPRPGYRRLLGTHRPYGGGNWWAITPGAARAILDADPRLVRLAKHMVLPDEFFFQTVVMNSRFADRVLPAVMYADWFRPDGPRPATIDELHVDTLEESELRVPPLKGDNPDADPRALFLRKVLTADAAALIRDRLWPIALPAPG